MKLKRHLLASAILAGALSGSVWAQKDPSPTPLGRETPFDEFNRIQIKNLQDESLGRIKDMGIDLVNGRIVEVFVVCDNSLGVGNKIVAVPPLALIPDLLNEVYRINVSAEVFKSAPEVTLKRWDEAGRSQRVAATYRHFGSVPYFLEEGATASATDSRPLVQLGYVERSNKLLDMPVGNHQGEKFGKVWSMSFDVGKGTIRNVIVIAPGNFKTKSVIPATALSFNADRDALLLDDTKHEFANEPRYVFTEAAYGNDATKRQEAYTGPRTTGPLEQGVSYRDIDRTVQINMSIRAAKIDRQHVEVATNDGRVTLRGWVATAEDKRRIGEIAIAASRVEVVDNQLVVGKPVTAN